MTMKLASVLFSSLLVAASAAPAIVWRQSSRTDQRALHSSTEVTASFLLADTLGSTVEDSTSVIFLLSQGADGSESLTELASSGKLPSTSLRYSDAQGVYHHVSDITNSNSIVRDATNTGAMAVHASLEELNNKLTSQPPAEILIAENGLLSRADKATNKRTRDLNSANVFVVTVDPSEDVSALDKAIVNTIEHETVDAVILAGIRSVNEVKHARYLLAKKQQETLHKSKLLARNRRRLEQEEQEGDEADDMNGDADYSGGEYFVHMTPNIFAGILFIFLFATITWIGINCLGAIAGQDVYVSKAPSIGREA